MAAAQSLEYRFQTSARRAWLAATRLIWMGCPADTVTVNGAGCSFPVSTVLHVRVTVAGVKLSDPAAHAMS